MTGRLIVHTRHEVIEVLLTGDPHVDALLERFCARGGAVLREPALQTAALADPPVGIKDRGDAWEPGAA